MPENNEWSVEFRDKSYFRLCDNQYYINNGKFEHLKEMDYCYFTGESLDFIECREVKNIRYNLSDYVFKGIHSLALVKTGLLKNDKQFLSGINELPISKDTSINIYFIF